LDIATERTVEKFALHVVADAVVGTFGEALKSKVPLARELMVRSALELLVRLALELLMASALVLFRGVSGYSLSG
jgi:hypothetical protein